MVAVDKDIDPDNPDARQASSGCKILHHKDESHGPRSMIDREDSAVLIDATVKETFPPNSLPKREFMERTKAIWEELGLPKLRPEMPWYG